MITAEEELLRNSKVALEAPAGALARVIEAVERHCSFMLVKSFWMVRLQSSLPSCGSETTAKIKIAGINSILGLGPCLSPDIQGKIPGKDIGENIQRKLPPTHLPLFVGLSLCPAAENARDPQKQTNKTIVMNFLNVS